MNQQAMLRKVRQLQNEMMATQKEINETEFRSSCGPVSVVVQGDKTVKMVKIDEDFEIESNDDRELLEDSVIAAINQVSKEIEEFTNEKMSKYQAMLGGVGGFF